jgi:hypothetical protein
MDGELLLLLDSNGKLWEVVVAVAAMAIASFTRPLVQRMVQWID